MLNAHHSKLLAGAAVAFAMAGAIVACSGESSDDAGARVPAEQAKSEVSRDMNPEVSSGNLHTLTKDNAAFGIELFRSLSTGNDNVFVSPHSISSALAMTFAGADGNTKTQMASALHFTLPEAELHAAFNRLDLDLESRGQNADPSNGEGFRFNVANAVWALDGYPWKDSYLDTLALNYGAGINLLGSFTGAEETINAWISGETNGKIPNLLTPGTLDSTTRMVLTNAVYFLGAWADPFNEVLTQDDTFHAVDGDVIVPMMRKTDSNRYAQGEGYQAIQLPYEGGGMVMTIVLPEEGRMQDVRSSMNGTFFSDLGGNAGYSLVALTLPKFEFRWGTMSVRGALSSMGMTDAFDEPVADFSGMADTSENLFIMDVVHQAFVSVDEAGTEAAAATAVIVGADSGIPQDPPEPVHMVVDRPFLFGISDTQTGALLFVGEVVDPS